MHKYILSLFILVLIFISSRAYSQNDEVIDGNYTVGKTSCMVEWDVSERVYKVYWKDGIGFTYLRFGEESPNGNWVWEEYESDFTTYTGRFTFKDNSYQKGEYERSDGKKFAVKKKN